MQASFLKEKKDQYKFTVPWDHYIIDDFLPLTEFKKIQSSLCTIEEGYQKRESDIFDLNFMFLPDMELAKFFLGDEFQEFLENLTQSQLNIYSKSLVQLRLMTPESPAFAPHVDVQDERSLVCLWYLSPGWNSEKGGELTLLKDKTSLVDSKVVAPLENRMVLFFSDETNWHSVNKVFDWNRYSVISEWIVTGENV